MMQWRIGPDAASSLDALLCLTAITPLRFAELVREKGRRQMTTGETSRRDVLWAPQPLP